MATLPRQLQREGDEVDMCSNSDALNASWKLEGRGSFRMGGEGRVGQKAV
jgi:hypothetical protein